MKASPVGCIAWSVLFVIASPVLIGLVMLFLLLPAGVVIGFLQHREYLRLEPVEARVLSLSIRRRLYPRVGDRYLGHFALARDHLVVGRKNPVVYVQTARRSLTVRRFTLTAVVTEMQRHETEEGKHRTEKKVIHEQQVRQLRDLQVPAGLAIRCKTHLPLSHTLPPTTPSHQRGYPRHQWHFDATLALDSGRTFRFRFPVTTRSMDAEESP